MIEPTTQKHSEDTGLPIRNYKFGDVVFANHVIIRRWRNEYDEGVYVIAIHGTIGVVIGTDDEGNVNVNFYGSGEAWIKSEDVNPYMGHAALR